MRSSTAERPASRGAQTVAVALLLAACSPADGPGNDQASAPGETVAAFTGSAACQSCHAVEHAAWRGSHHDLALQPATPDTVLGDFDDVTVELNGSVSRFFRRDGEFLVETEAADGSLGEFRVVHSFGVDPLQQYLVEYERGRLQALSIAWDTRPAEDGGQRWFHLYGDEPVPAGDPLHWTGTLQNWNSMCADCHSTGVVKGYDFGADSYATTFAVEDVGCEACHGPGSAHVESPGTQRMHHGAIARAWVFGEGAPIATRAGPVPASPEIDTCARCHSRRAQLDDAAPLTGFLEAYRPEWLERGPYFDDGQVREEVYVYGSFLQSRMHAAGVTCSDCHEPHGLQLRASGDALCGSCHSSAVFAAVSHHRHAEVETGLAPGCVDCHMRATTFMQVDARRDHGFRVPRPDLTVATGVANACNDCHDERDATWAAAAVAGWYPDGRQGSSHFGNAFAAVRDWQTDSLTALLPIAADRQAAAIVRASALAGLGAAVNEVDAGTLERLAADSSELVRLALIDASRELPPARRIPLVQRFLSDAPLALRIAAAEALQPARAELGPGRQADLDAALDEALSAREFGSDRPEGLIARASIQAIAGSMADARASLAAAIERFPWFVPAYVNLADLERAGGRDQAALDVVDAGLAVQPTADSLHIARGLALVRLGRVDEAVDAFADARTLAPDSPYNAYLYGVALHSRGDVEAAVAVLEQAAAAFPAYADIWYALATMTRDAGDVSRAAEFARRGRVLAPSDPRFTALLEALGAD